MLALYLAACHTPEAATTVSKCSWGWTQKASETCRALLQLLINILPSCVTLVLYIYLSNSIKTWMLFLLSSSMIGRRLQDSNLDSRNIFEFLSLCACRRNQFLVKGSVSALRWSGKQCLLQWNTVHSGNDGKHNVNVHPLEGDEGPYQIVVGVYVASGLD